MTLKEFASLGGKARAKKLSKSERSAIARKAAIARWNKHAGKNDASSQSNEKIAENKV